MTQHSSGHGPIHTGGTPRTLASALKGDLLAGAVKVLVLLMSLLEGCALMQKAQSPAASPSHTYERRCSPVSPVGPLDADPHLVPDDRIAVMRTQFSPAAFEMTNALGMLSSLDRLLQLEAQIGPSGEGPALQYLRERRHITDRITLGMLEVSSAAGESDCEEGRAMLLAELLQEEREERTGVYTVLALIGSGAAAVITGGIALAASGVSTAANIGAVIGGSFELTFGLMAETGADTEELHHPRNLLRNIWTGKNTTFPTPVWNFMNTRVLDDPSQQTLRELLIVRWREEGRLGKAESEMEQHRIQLFFGDGGTYSVDELRARAAMLDLLRTDISLMHQGLSQLIRELLVRDKL